MKCAASTTKTQLAESGSGDAGAAAQGSARSRRDPDRAGDGSSPRRHDVRPATSPSFVSRRLGVTIGDCVLLVHAHGGEFDRQEGARRPLCAHGSAALGDAANSATSRRDQGLNDRSRRQGQPPVLCRRRPCRRRTSRRRPITWNYDGFFKHKTTIGAGAFIGTNTSLVAPVKIGKGAYIGSGSVITKDVPDDVMAVGRSPKRGRGEALSRDEAAGEEAEGGVSAVGWVERSDTHQCRWVWRWVSLRSTHPTKRDEAARGGAT